LKYFISKDASILGVGGTIGNGDQHCGYYSHTEAKSKWKTIEQEVFAIVISVMFFRSVLLGNPFLLETGHRNLRFIHGGTSFKVVRRALVLQEFRVVIKHTLGEDSVVAD
jgi:hypothetical protein